MVNKLIQMMIAMVIGLALLPVVNDFVTDLTETGGALEGNDTLIALVELLPVLYVIVLVAGSIAYITIGKKSNI